MGSFSKVRAASSMFLTYSAKTQNRITEFKHFWGELSSNPVIQQRIISPVTTCPIHLFFKHVDFVISFFLRLLICASTVSKIVSTGRTSIFWMARLKSSSSFLRHTVAPDTPIHDCSPESFVDWEHVKQGHWHVNLSTDILKNLCLQHFAHFVVRSADQRRMFWLFMLQRNRSLGARQHENFFQMVAFSAQDFVSHLGSHLARGLSLPGSAWDWYSLMTNLLSDGCKRINHAPAFVWMWRCLWQVLEDASPSCRLSVQMKNTKERLQERTCGVIQNEVWIASIFREWKNLWWVCELFDWKCWHIWFGFPGPS